MLDPQFGGPPVPLVAPRRTIYAFVDRLDVPPLMTTFDFPAPSASCPQRAETTIAPQALYLMNNEFAADCAHQLLRRPDVSGLVSVRERLERIHRILYSRLPTTSEEQRGETFLGQTPDTKAW